MLWIYHSLRYTVVVVVDVDDNGSVGDFSTVENKKNKQLNKHA